MVQLKQKVTLKRKQDVGVTQIKPKSKWWLLLLLVGVIIVGVILIVKNNTSKSTDKSLITKTEETTIKAKEVISEVQSGNVNYEDAKAKVAVAQKEVDEAKANAKTDEEKQAVAVAQAKVDEAAKAIEASKQAAQTSETNKTSSPVEGEGISSTTPVEKSKPDNTATQKPEVAKQVSQSSTKKSSSNASSPSSATVPEGTLEQKAKDVVRGIYGNGADRVRALGSEYDAIQSRVNEMYRNGEII